MSRIKHPRREVISIEWTGPACSPGAHLPAVWVRHTQLRALDGEGAFAAWQQGTVLDDAVFHLAAQIPITGTHLDQQDFLSRLRAAQM